MGHKGKGAQRFFWPQDNIGENPNPMSKTWKKKKKWYDDEYDFRDNQRRINKKKRRRERDGELEEEQDFLARREFPQSWRGKPPRR